MTYLNSSSLLKKGLLLGGALVVLTACNTFQTEQKISEGIDYREARFEEITAMREYRGCVDEALALDAKARTNQSAGQYMASAKMVQSCESGLGPNVAGIAVEERMRAYGLSVQNFVKGGDIVSAQSAFGTFKSSFGKNDLYYTDGSSFTETMSALLGRESDSSYGQYSMLNVNKQLKQEMRRKTYWATN